MTSPIKPFYFDITDPEIEQFLAGARQILQSGSLILGDHTRDFEQAFAQFVGTRYAIAVNSGTSGLEILLRIKQAENTTILVPTNTNFATVATVLRVNSDVQYLDMDPATFAPTLAMVQEAVEGKTYPKPLKGVLWVHIGGVISPEFPAVVEYCRQKGLFIWEDTAHAHGSQLQGIQAGNFGDGASFSFFPTKVMTTFEGGMVTLNDEEGDILARSLRNQGKRGMNFGGLHTDFGNSTRMTEIHALLGQIQLAKLPQMLAARQAVYDRIAHHLRSASLAFVSTEHMDQASQYKLVVLVPDGKDPQAVKQALAAEDIYLGGTVYEIPCHQQPVFKGVCDGQSFPLAEKWCPRHICPPLTSGMTPEDGDRVGEALVRHLKP